MHETQIDFNTIQSSFKITIVHTRIINVATRHFSFVDIDFGAIKSALIIDNGYHKFDRIIHFQIQTLITLNSIRSRVCFAKGIACKRFDLSVNFGAQFLGMTFGFTTFEKMIFYFLQCCFRATFSTHSTT